MRFDDQDRSSAVGAFNDAQQVWSGRVDGYPPAKLVLFWDATRSGCGDARSEVGPFYCPADERVYIDLGFYRELAARFGAPGFGRPAGAVVPARLRGREPGRLRHVLRAGAVGVFGPVQGSASR